VSGLSVPDRSQPLRDALAFAVLTHFGARSDGTRDPDALVCTDPNADPLLVLG
jgi:hypothetical protein